ncbi:Cu-oxidase-domain-containing protein [Mycena leptocephala]|nr:Cu-oxidase-domain-containing protein [Mycena leptocephala]
MQFPLALLALLAVPVLAATGPPDKHITLDIVNGPLAPDGALFYFDSSHLFDYRPGFNRIGVLANGTFPGPIITATKGQKLIVKTDGSMRLSTSIDFDGVLIDTPNVFNEGSPFVTTCPFGPNTSYTYELPLGQQTGSFWYHSQLSVQYADGLRGPVIIYDPNDPLAHLYDVDDESTIWTVADWWHNTSVANLASYNATELIPYDIYLLCGVLFSYPIVILSVSDSGLFNGAGRFNGGPIVPYAVSKVTKGTRYRFRLINISARTSFIVSIDNHTMTVIETDGIATSPINVNILTIHAGQRYSIVVNANQPVGNYWINTILNGGNPVHNLNLNVTLGRGILRYKGAPAQEPATPMTLGPAVQIPLEEPCSRFPQAPTPDFNLSFVTAISATPPVHWTINGISYKSPVIPTLVKVLDGANSSADFDPSENTFVFPANKVIQVEFPPDPNDELHPFHLHGNNFWLVKNNDSDVINTVNPIIRDTAGTALGGMIVRFTTDKPGPWFFHCHIFFHFWAGLGSVMLGGPDEIRKQVHPTDAWDALCPAYNALPPSQQ